MTSWSRRAGNQIDKRTHVWRIPALNSKSKRIRSVPLNDSALESLNQLDTDDKLDYLYINRKTKMPCTTITIGSLSYICLRPIPIGTPTQAAVSLCSWGYQRNLVRDKAVAALRRLPEHIQIY